MRITSKKFLSTFKVCDFVDHVLKVDYLLLIPVQSAVRPKNRFSPIVDLKYVLTVSQCNTVVVDDKPFIGRGNRRLTDIDYGTRRDNNQ